MRWKIEKLYQDGIDLKNNRPFCIVDGIQVSVNIAAYAESWRLEGPVIVNANEAGYCVRGYELKSKKRHYQEWWVTPVAESS